MKVPLHKVENLFSDYLDKKQLKYTPERRVILKEVFSLNHHFEADELYFKLRQRKGHKISRATVYRTLPLLEESGLIRKVVFVDKHTHYELVYGTMHHEHLICINCGNVIEFYKKALEDSLEEVAREHSFEPIGHKLEITGYCKKCSKKVVT